MQPTAMPTSRHIPFRLSKAPLPVRARSVALLLGWAVALLAAAPRADAQPIVLDQIASGLGSVTYVTHAGDEVGTLVQDP